MKANPEIWDYFRARADEERGAGEIWDSGWTVTDNYRADMMAPGDLIALWVTGHRDPGIYELGQVTSTASYVTGMDETYAVDLDKARRPTRAVDFEAAALDPPIDREELAADRVLRSCEQFRIPQGPNPSFLTKAEAGALKRLAEGRLPRKTLQRLGWAQ